ncbi:MAG: hypothetical protein AB8B64_14560 [Granulosicoccus sp.]
MLTSETPGAVRQNGDSAIQVGSSTQNVSTPTRSVQHDESGSVARRDGMATPVQHQDDTPLSERSVKVDRTVSDLTIILDELLNNDCKSSDDPIETKNHENQVNDLIEQIITRNEAERLKGSASGYSERNYIGRAMDSAMTKTKIVLEHTKSSANKEIEFIENSAKSISDGNLQKKFDRFKKVVIDMNVGFEQKIDNISKELISSVDSGVKDHDSRESVNSALRNFEKKITDAHRTFYNSLGEINRRVEHVNASRKLPSCAS